MSKKSRATNNETVYEDTRNNFLHSTDIPALIDDAHLFMSRQRISELLFKSDIFRKVLDIPGSIVECGVKRGGGLMQFAHLSSILEPYNHTRKIYGFDTFEGFRSISDKDDSRVDESMFSDADDEIIKKSIEIYDMNRPLGHLQKVEIIKGDAVETLPLFVNNKPELVISLLYIDFDIYKPTLVALETLFPLVPKGGIVVFDELNDERWPGETLAVKEFFDLNKIQLRRVPYDPLPAYFVV